MHFLVELMQDDCEFIKHISVSSRGNRILYSFTYFFEYRWDIVLFFKYVFK